MGRAAGTMAMVALFSATFVAPAAAFQRPGHPPDAEFQVRLGHFFLAGDSNFWDETGEAFTLDESDLDDSVLGFSYVRSLSNVFEVGANLDFYDSVELSDYREYEDILGNPIYHDTELNISPLTVDARFVPGGRYRLRPGGRFNPRPVFYVGLGAGLAFWEYEEYGDFVIFAPDGEPLGIATNLHLDDDGVALEIHGLVGLELPLSRAAHLLFEGRYSLAEDDLGGDFGDLDNREIDLGGASLFAGFSFRF